MLSQCVPSRTDCPLWVAQAEGSYGASIYDRAPPARASSLRLPGQSSQATEPSFAGFVLAVTSTKNLDGHFSLMRDHCGISTGMSYRVLRGEVRLYSVERRCAEQALRACAFQPGFGCACFNAASLCRSSTTGTASLCAPSPCRPPGDRLVTVGVNASFWGTKKQRHVLCEDAGLRVQGGLRRGQLQRLARRPPSKRFAQAGYARDIQQRDCVDGQILRPPVGGACQ
jgi:hypothetical protein